MNYVWAAVGITIISIHSENGAVRAVTCPEIQVTHGMYIVHGRAILSANQQQNAYVERICSF
jgi:hypothetical protein